MMRNAVTALLLSLLLLACKDENKDENWIGTSTDTSGTATETASATHPASPGGTALVPDVTSGTTVLVVLEDGSIAVRQQAIPAGPAIFTVENGGSNLHNLFIEGNGISRAAGDNIAEGKSATVDVNLEAGTYTLYCPVGDHRTQGEQVQITVGGPGVAPAAGTATTGTTTGTTATTGS